MMSKALGCAEGTLAPSQDVVIEVIGKSKEESLEDSVVLDATDTGSVSGWPELEGGGWEGWEKSLPGRGNSAAQA